MDSIIKFTDEKVEEDWKEKGQRPLASALQAFEEAFHELYTGPAPYSYKLKNNFELRAAPNHNVLYILAEGEVTMRKLWNAWVAYKKLRVPLTEKVGKLGDDKLAGEYDVWEMKNQCAHELCWAARQLLCKAGEDIAEGTLRWTETPGNRNWKVDWISSWLPNSARPVPLDFAPSINDLPDLVDDTATVGGSDFEGV
jgi:hypothetical protein